jgi:ribosomal-protein-alanine N-acetyltransferase
MRSFQYELDNRETIMNVAVIDGRIVGFVCLRTILDVTHVLNIAVVPSYRRRGIGNTLLQKALQDLRLARPGAKPLTLEVRESNNAAIGLYEKAGFYVAGKRPGYYHNPVENAVIMELKKDDRERKPREKRWGFLTG